MECLTPPLNAVPVEEWFCPQCAPNNRTTGKDLKTLITIPLYLMSFIQYLGIFESFYILQFWLRFLILFGDTHHTNKLNSNASKVRAAQSTGIEVQGLALCVHESN